nr:unnamed protein product [Callosobruchus analis]
MGIFSHSLKICSAFWLHFQLVRLRRKEVSQHFVG